MQSNVQSQLCILVFPVQSMESELSWDQLDCIWLKESRRQIYVVCQRISPRICSRIAKHDSACGGELGRVARNSTCAEHTASLYGLPLHTFDLYGPCRGRTHCRQTAIHSQP